MSLPAAEPPLLREAGTAALPAALHPLEALGFSTSQIQSLTSKFQPAGATQLVTLVAHTGGGVSLACRSSES